MNSSPKAGTRSPLLRIALFGGVILFVLVLVAAVWRRARSQRGLTDGPESRPG